MCAMELKSYDWDLRNKAKNSPKMTKNFGIFCYSQILYTVYGVIILHNIAEYMQFDQTCMTGIRASQKEKDLILLLYRACGSGTQRNLQIIFNSVHSSVFFKTFFVVSCQKLPFSLLKNFSTPKKPIKENI